MGCYRAMSECSKYQLLFQTDYVSLREKYDNLYIHSNILPYTAFRESSQLFFPTKDSVLSSGLTITACEPLVDIIRRYYTVILCNHYQY